MFTYFRIASVCLLKGAFLFRHFEVGQLYTRRIYKRGKKSTARDFKVTGTFFFYMVICYFGYVYIAVSGVVASLVSLSPIWYLPVPGANAIPAAPPRVQLLVPLVLEPETTESKTTLGCSSCSHFFW